MSPSRRRFLEFALAIAAVAVALLARWFFDPVLGERVPFASLLGAVAVAVGFGGLYPALLATTLGYLGSSWLFLEPRGAVQLETPAEWILLGGYLFACFTIIFFGLLMRRAERRQARTAIRLAKLNQRKDDLLATVAHEMRNPLLPIRTAARVLRENDLSDVDVRQTAGMIERQVDHLARLIDDLVAMDRIARQGLELRPTRLSFAALVARVVDSRRLQLDRRHHRLTLELPAQPLYLEADADRLEQVVINLLTNAIKFTPTGGSIAVLVDEEVGHARLRVRDTGIGIASEAIPRLFELYFRAERTQPGLGIGLALVRQLVEVHRGTVSVSSGGAGLGSEFVVRLPLSANQEGNAVLAATSPNLAGKVEVLSAP